MKLILITSSEPINSEAVDLIIAAAESRSYQVERLNIDQVSLSDLGDIQTTNEDILYREALGAKARAVEAHFILRNKSQQPANLRRSKNVSLGNFQWDETARHQSYGVPIIPSIFLDDTWAQKTPQDIDSHVESLGGFPIILKRTGLSHGLGVQLVDSSHDLLIILNENRDANLMNFALRKYLSNYEHARLIVLGDKVVDSVRYEIPADDFRTNAHQDITVVAKDYAENVTSIAVNATIASGVEFGGADVLIDLDTNTPYLAEMNFPCNFARAQMVTNKDIAGMIIDHLKNSVAS